MSSLMSIDFYASSDGTLARNASGRLQLTSLLVG